MGGYVPVGGEFQVNSATAYNQVAPAITALADGGFVVVWTSRDGLTDRGIYAQRFDAAGHAIGGETLVAAPGRYITDPVVTALTGGGFVVGWQFFDENGRYDVAARRFDATGTATGDAFPISGAAIDETYLSLAGLSGGGFVATWLTPSAIPTLHGQRFDAGGDAVGGDFTVGAAYVGAPVTAALADGGFVVTWMGSNPVSNSNGIYAQRFDATATPRGDAFLVSPPGAFQETFPEVAGLPDGGFVVTWYSAFDTFYESGTYARRYDAAGAPVGGFDQTPDQRNPVVAALSDGGFAIAWDSVFETNGAIGQDGFDVFARTYGATAAAGDLPVDGAQPGDQFGATIAGLRGGGFVVAWASSDGDGYGIFARRFGPADVGTGPDTLVLRVSQQAFQGDAQFTVSVDGVQQGGVRTASSIFGTGTDTFVLNGDWGPGGHIVTVDFLNDAYGGSLALDRNLFVQGIAYNGEEFLAGPVGLFSNGPRSFNFADTGDPASPPAGPDTLVVQVSEHAYQGHAAFTISVDGVQQGGVYTAATAFGEGRDTVRLTGDFGSGPHSIAVAFINDAYGGSLDLDRNLFVEDVIYNGIDRLDGTIGLFSNGAATISVIA